MVVICHLCKKQITLEDVTTVGIILNRKGNPFHIDCHYMYYEFERKYDDIVLDDFDTEKKTRKFDPSQST